MMRIKSATDFIINIAIWGACALIVSSIMVIPENEMMVFLFIGIPVVGFLLWIYFGSYYEFREEYLYCRCGPFFEKIRYDQIKCAKLTTNFLSSMALSTKRIEIRQHGKGYLTGTSMISPINREQFLEELIQRCPNIDKIKC